MKTRSIAHTTLYVGAAIGLLLFALIGLLPSLFVGGVLGLKMATYLFGVPLGTAIIPRIIVGVSMVLGISLGAVVFTVGMSLIGWVFGHVADLLRASRAARIDLTPKSNKA